MFGIWASYNMSQALVVFDFDGTITEEASSWSVLHSIFGTVGAARENERLYREGRISYLRWAQLDAALWKGKDEKIARSALSDVRVRPGYRKLFNELKKLGVFTAIVSAGLSYAVQPVAATLGVDYSFFNILEARQGTLTGRVFVNVEPRSKGEIVDRLSQKLGLSRTNVVTVGDADADEHMFRKAGLAVAFNPTDTRILPMSHALIQGEVEKLGQFLKWVLNVKTHR
jgi:phosphoserine phosphatase